MKKSRPIPPVSDRPKQEVPVDIVTDLMGAIRSQFFAESFTRDPKLFKRWKQDQAFMLKNVVLWPAAWLTRRGVTLKPERYKQIILEVINEVKAHGKTEAIKYWPGYLMKCVQSRFKHHEDDIYAEAKSLRTQIERVMASAKAAPRAPDPIQALAAAQQVLSTQTRAKKRHSKSAQMEMF